jgi:hypothetical protein
MMDLVEQSPVLPDFFSQKSVKKIFNVYMQIYTDFLRIFLGIRLQFRNKMNSSGMELNGSGTALNGFGTAPVQKSVKIHIFPEICKNICTFLKTPKNPFCTSGNRPALYTMGL